MIFDYSPRHDICSVLIYCMTCHAYASIVIVTWSSSHHSTSFVTTLVNLIILICFYPYFLSLLRIAL